MSVTRAIGVLVLISALAATASSQPAQQPPAPLPAPHTAPAPLAPPATPTFEVKVASVDAVHAIVLPMKGSYMQHPEALGKLGVYLSGRGITPTGPAFGRYFSDPSVREADLVWEVGLPVAADATVEAPFEVRDVPAAQYAIHTYRGPTEEIGKAWGSLIDWVMSHGYQPVMPATQVFTGGMTGSFDMELRIAVQK